MNTPAIVFSEDLQKRLMAEAKACGQIPDYITFDGFDVVRGTDHGRLENESPEVTVRVRLLLNGVPMAEFEPMVLPNEGDSMRITGVEIKTKVVAL